MRQPSKRFANLAMTISAVLFAGTLSAEPRVPVKPLRESARKILADPEFRHFDHFADDDFRKPQGTTEPGANNEAATDGDGETSSSTPNDSDTTPTNAQPWWQELLNRNQRNESGKDAGSSRNKRLSPSNPSDAGSQPTSGSERDSTNTSTDGDQRGSSSSSSKSDNHSRSNRSGNRSNSTPSDSDDNRQSARSKSSDQITDDTSSAAPSSPMGSERTSPTGGDPKEGDNSPDDGSMVPRSGAGENGMPTSSGDSQSEGNGSSSSSSGNRSATNRSGNERAKRSSSGTVTDGESAAEAPPTSSQNPSRNPRTPTRAESSNRSPTNERPTRIQRSQRGSDGVQRPVRQTSRSAPTPRQSTPSDGPRWEGPSLALGNLFGGLFHGLAYLILAVIVVAILALIVQALAQAWNDRQSITKGVGDVTVGPLAHDRSPGETESDVFLREALALAQNGDFRAAIGRLVLGGMSFIERQQWIRYRRGLTVHDYLRVLRSRPEQFAGFREVVHVFEPVEYGRRPATEPLFAEALAGYQQGFQRRPVDAEIVS